MTTKNKNHITELARRIRYLILTSTTKAGSGHATSSLSAVELATTLFFGGFFRYDAARPQYANNDRLLFSKGHASPLLYSLWAAAGVVTERELMKLRTFASPLEGHPSMRFRYTEAATGSLGQGLSIGFGMALAAKYLERAPYRVFVLLGDSEMAEGAVWETVQLAAFYRLNNLIAIIDVNRLGQRGETMYGHHVEAYKKRLGAFGWDTIIVDGHSVENIELAYREALLSRSRPVAIIARTIKGKGVSFLENRNGWHGKALNPDELQRARIELGSVDRTLTGELAMPPRTKAPGLPRVKAMPALTYRKNELVATRKAYGDALVALHPSVPQLVVLDGEVSNSTYAEIFAKAYPKRYFEMFIAEQNMAGAAAGLAARGFLPFVSSFAAFLTRAFDQIRMAAYSNVHIVFSGSHAGVSIGEDGPSQMGLEDLAMFRSVQGSIVLYPSDAAATRKLVAQAARAQGIVYLRTTRGAVPLLYPSSQSFPIGGSKILKQSRKDVATVVAAGITVHEALAAYEELKKRKLSVRVIDAYSVKPIDTRTLRRAAQQTKHIVVAEDHVPQGGLADAVREALDHTPAKVYSLAVRKTPRSGKTTELLQYEGISAKAIAQSILVALGRAR